MVAIYCRQSVDKRDSISIEQQIAHCKKELEIGEKFEIYKDKGYSGSNTDRPEFRRMTEDIRSGLVTKIIVYKLDRISRSLIDFVGMMDMFKKENVKFTSTSESFDTSTPYGRAMLEMLMVFAQFERESIQKRVKDNFYERGKKGIFLAGTAPYGFRKEDAVIGGVNTKRLAPEEGKIEAVKRIFADYAKENVSLGDITRDLNKRGLHTNRDKPFTTVAVRRILSNPVYVRADAEIYFYLKARGAVLNQPIEEYTGVCGCTVYGDRKAKKKSKFKDYIGEYVQLNTHEGVIDSDIWLAVQDKLERNTQVKNLGKGKNSWLSGLIRCGGCGMAISVVNGQRNGRRYVNCGGRKQKFCCSRKRRITFDEIESAVEESLTDYIRGFGFDDVVKRRSDDTELCELKTELVKTDEEIARLIDSSSGANGAAWKYINKRIAELDTKRAELAEELSKLNEERKLTIKSEQISKAVESRDKLSLEQKKSIAKMYIGSVILTDDNIEVNYLV